MAERELTPELFRQLFNPRDLNAEPPEPPEPAVEGVPPRDKPFSEYTEAEHAASRADFDRTQRERGKQERREQKERAERERAEANRTDAERHGDALSVALSLDGKRAADLALIESLHGGTDGGTPIALDPIEVAPPGPPADRGDALQAGDEPFPSE